jgi:hypothetical protein
MSKNSRYKTHRGLEFNMSAFIEKNGDTRAVGNASMNARGDIIDQRTGKVKVPANKIAQASANLSNSQTKKVSLKADQTITPVKRDTPTPDTTIKPTVEPEEVTEPVVDGPTIVSSRKVDTPDGPATEYEYSDGSMQVIPDSDSGSL